tara:strand:+ start:72 stop:497 length:426 start_codon:yes stop_codon:yes gene_type:complete
LLLLVTALEFVIKKIKMKNLIVDAATDKIFFKIIVDKEAYTSEYLNSRENFDNFAQLLFNFLKENNTSIEEINNIFVNQGPGKFSGIRISISIVKALSITNNLNLYGFSSEKVKNYNYNKIIDLFNRGLLIKNLIKAQYLS